MREDAEQKKNKRKENSAIEFIFRNKNKSLKKNNTWNGNAIPCITIATKCRTTENKQTKNKHLPNFNHTGN